jgi:DNA (cytosine-5)-methyltransferase 1
MPKYTCTQTGQTFKTKKEYTAHLESLVKTIPKETVPNGLLAISLFSGAGGDTLGMENAGIKVVAFSENNKDCILTHKAQFPESKLLGESVKGDISKIPDTEFEAYTGKIHVVFAGFPCQGFSNAGKKDANDPRNKMFHQFLRVVNIVKPTWIIGENVSGLLTKKTDDGDSKVMDVIQEHFTDIGYPLKYKVYDMSSLGVPQSRKRLLMIGNCKHIPFEMPEFKEAKKGLQHIVQPVLENAMECSLDPPKDCVVSIPEDIEPQGTPHPYLVKKYTEGLISFSKRDSPIHSEVLNLNNPCKTIICAYTFQPRHYVCLKKPSGKTYIRCLTVSELGQIQGFPKDYPFKGSQDAMIKQIGNAVPSTCIKKIVETVILTNSEQH